jgi:hypothetical protein
MSKERREHLREVMSQAWRIFRLRHIPGSDVQTFGHALRNAWAWAKRQALPALPAGPTLHLRSMLQSPIRRALRGQRYAGDRARTAGYVTSMLGA